MEYDKVNPLLLLAIAGLIVFESLLIWKGAGGEYMLLIVGSISYLAGVKTPDFISLGAKSMKKKL